MKSTVSGGLSDLKVLTMMRTAGGGVKTKEDRENKTIYSVD